MKLPEEYSHLSYEQKKAFIEKVINLYWNEKIKNLINSEEFWKENVEFLFSYIFSDGDKRAKTWEELGKEYGTYEKILQWCSQKLSKFNLEANEIKSDIKDEEDVDSLENQILSL